MDKPGRRTALAMFGVIVTGAAGRAADRAGEVRQARGDCYAIQAGGRRDLAPAAAVFVGDTVRTGDQSALALLLGEATLLRLGQNARLRIDRFIVRAGGVLTLQSGPMLIDNDAAALDRDMRIRSPFGLIAVRGTQFWGGPSNGVFGVFVRRGQVAVTGRRKTVVLEAGQGTNIAHPGDEPTDPAPWGEPRLRAAMASVM